MARGQPWLRIAGAVVLALPAGAASPAVLDSHRLAVAAGTHAAPSGRAGGPVIIAYLFPKDAVVDPAAIAADKLTHINYAFANVAGGRVVEGFAHDAENFRVLAGLRRARSLRRRSTPVTPTSPPSSRAAATSDAGTACRRRPTSGAARRGHS